MRRSQSRSSRIQLFLLGAVLLALALWQILVAGQGLEITTLRSTNPPLTIVAPAGIAPGERPLVLIAHGFAGSGTLMRGFAFTLAHAGYATVSWDFDGHGANPVALGARPLIDDADAALAEAQARGLVTPGKVAVLGHSMGSGVALQFGQTHPDTAATIAISPVGQTVTQELPRNLLLMAGALEPQFQSTAESLLAQAGGAGGEIKTGTARQYQVIPNVEHMSIVFAPATQGQAVAWLDSVFGRQPGATAYSDVRMVWYALGLAGVMLIAAALASRLWDRVYETDDVAERPLLRRVAALLGGVIAASALLWLAGELGLNMRTLFGLSVGGYLMIWFALAGLVALALLRAPLALPSARAVFGGLLVFAALWLGVGLLADVVWYPWLLIWPRLRLWPLAVVCLLPWFIAVGQLVGGSGLAVQLGRWLAHSLVLGAGLFLALQLTPAIGFMMLILPALPVLFLVHAIASAPHRGWRPFALSGALFTSWMLLAIFPLQ